ncbi:molybdopterin-dependent oxidoreductase [Rhodobacter sp. NTK016B]|uniref:molybdopterin-dependent oxidoreductase n=1 Tax=Rhodobacter sp. NTK016B TaxID=2759676 RepID=UPI001A8D3CCF|nr:molybdopterin-dependent oxidoreductase [Rhodobacter sp. NTK016B]MBN8290658.1 molybdopterin-dependent oxidoreductase [Rhodobacter sp. NTK016B]
MDGHARTPLVGTHWGHFRVSADASGIRDVQPYEGDDNPSCYGASLADGFDTSVRIAQPMVRKGWLETRDGTGRSKGQGPFVPVSWDTALDLVAGELERVRSTMGNEAIYGGSYGWASAGRFHHAQSQVHRFLNGIGGYVSSRNSYSAAAAEVIVPHVLGLSPYTVIEPSYEEILAHGSLMVAFGGVCPHNNQVVPGGVLRHNDRALLSQFRERGIELVNISPMRQDVPAYMDQTWVPIRPGTDVALMMGIAHELITHDLCDQTFLNSHTVGFDDLAAYITGKADGCVRDADWAAALCGVEAGQIRALARKMVGRRTVIALSLSMQRAEFGEQPYFMGIALAAMLGQIGLPGGGVGLSWGNNGRGLFGTRRVNFSWGKLPQGSNPVEAFIPVARIADMLANPGAPFDYDGQRYQYPDIRLVYWAGGNPYHHHQDLAKLERAWERPETIIVQDSVWTASARRADIVLPATTFLEREDVVCGLGQSVSFSAQAAAPYAQARDDYAIFSDLARRMGTHDAFTEGRDSATWIRHIYQQSRDNAAAAGIQLPDFETLRTLEVVDVTDQLPRSTHPLEEFHNDPLGAPLGTPSGRIELSSERLASFGYDDCPRHPVWLERKEWLGAPLAYRFPLHLLSPQPQNRLHSQFDFGRASRDAKIEGREVMIMSCTDATQRGLTDGDIARVYNDRGETFVGVRVTDALMQGVVQLPTGAWYDPDEDGIDRHGNPNVLCADRPTSRLAMGPTAQSCLVQVDKHTGPLPEIRVFTPPLIERAED